MYIYTKSKSCFVFAKDEMNVEC